MLHVYSPLFNLLIHKGTLQILPSGMCAHSTLFSSDKLQPFILHIPYLCLGNQHSTVHGKCNDVGGNLARILLRFQGQNYLIVCVWNKFKRGEAVGWVERSYVLLRYGAEICGAGQHEVGGTPLVCSLFVVLVAGTAGEEEPALKTLAPRG